MSTTSSPPRGEPVAVIGMALCLPGAETLERFWQQLIAGRDCLHRPSLAELERAGVGARLLADPSLVAAKPMLRRPDLFDAGFFGISMVEAELLDPGHRLFLECLHQAMESAGEVPGDGRADGRRTGVFAGVEAGETTYLLQNLFEPGVTSSPSAAFTRRLANGVDYLALRASHSLDLTGPSVALAATCATSLVAVHLALRSLQAGDSTLAIAGGARIELPLAAYYRAGIEGMSSPTGVIRPFDAAADGTIFGSGVAAVVLKRLDAAIADGNPVRGVILGSAFNNDGDPADKQSLTAPTVSGQQRAINRALSRAAINPGSVGFIECHGTATVLGDPIEIGALAATYGSHLRDGARCALGSVKGNVGHLGVTSGVASLIKTCLALERGQVPPVANLERPSSAIAPPFFVNAEPASWPNREGSPRRAAVSSFGFGGGNAHLVVEQAPPAGREGDEEAPLQLLVLSAQSAVALRRRREDLAVHLEDRPARIGDVAHTLQAGREAMAHRAWVVIDSADERTVATQLREGLELSHAPARRPLVFLFPGQGSQVVGMGRALYEREPVYREALDYCAEFLVEELGFDLRAKIFPPEGTPQAEARAALAQTAVTQPSLFAVEYALTKLYLHWGLRPDAMLGHSLGEFVAATFAGVFSIDTVLRVIAVRSQLMGEAEPGAMAAVFLPRVELERRLPTDLDLAALNAPRVQVVAGPTPAVRRFCAKLDGEGIGHRLLETSHAFHSRTMDPSLEPFRRALSALDFNPPTAQTISNVTGAPLTAAEACDPEYWVAQRREPVQFSRGLSSLDVEGDPIFVEVGPGKALCGLVRQHDDARDVIGTMDLRRAEAAGREDRLAREALGRAWSLGAEVDWSPALCTRRGSPRKLQLPTYPFQRKSYWRAARAESPRAAAPGRHPLPLYELGWVAEAAEAGELAEADHWLIFADRFGVAERVVAGLALAPEEVTLIKPGPRFAREPSGRWSWFTVEPGEAAHLEQLIDERGLDRGSRLRALHFWCLGEEPAELELEAFERCCRVGFYALLALVQAVHAAGRGHRLDAQVYADGVAQVAATDTLRPEKGSLLGPCMVVPQEVERLTMRCVDIPSAADGLDRALAEALVIEARTNTGCALSALRPEGGSVARYAEELFELPELALGRPRLREGGVVLITGGVGGLGLAIAERLFDEVGARLVLTSRWPAPPQEQWATLAAAEPRSKRGRALAALGRLVGRGAQVLVVRADASQRDDLAGAIETARRTFGALHGVIHGAGIVGRGLAVHKTRAEAERVFAAKVKGAYHLEQLLAHQPLDLFVHHSSIASVRPAAGQSDYAAANAVLDRLARRRSASAPGLSCAVGWDAWRDAGMAWDMVRDERAGEGEAPGQAVERAHAAPTTGVAKEMVLGRTGDLESFAWRERASGRVGEGQVAIEIKAAGLSFRDVLRALGQLPEDGGDVESMGGECSGIVSEVGPGVAHLRRGDRVVAHAGGCLATRVVAEACAVARLPEALTFVEGASVPLAFLTAEHGLCHLARLEAGERVLIHAAAGGVGLAAIQLAQRVGAEIYATAGSEAKRDYLRGLGVEHVMGSRSLEFVEQTLAATGGEGVDVVLNSLTGELLSASLGLLRPFGRFIELGSKDIDDQAKLGLLPLRNNISLHGIELGQLAHHRPEVLSEMFESLMRRFATEELRPLPITRLPFRSIASGFERMARAEHIGKIVFVPGDEVRGADEIVRDGFRVRYGRGIGLDEGLEVLTRLIASDETPPVVVAAGLPLVGGDVSRRREAKVTAMRTVVTPYREPSNAREALLKRLWERSLGVAPIGVDDDFVDLGGDSIKAIMLQTAVCEAFKVDLSLTAIVSYPTIAQLAELLARRAPS